MKDPLSLAAFIGIIVGGLLGEFISIIGKSSFLKKGFRGALSVFSYYMGIQSIADDQWIFGALFSFWARSSSTGHCCALTSLCRARSAGSTGKRPGGCARRMSTSAAIAWTACTQCWPQPTRRPALPSPRSEYVSDDNREVRCSLCRKHRYQVNAMAAAVRLDSSVERGAGPAGRDTRICNRCLSGCDYLLSRRLEREDERTGATHGPRATEK